MRAAREAEPIKGATLPNFLIIGAIKAGTTSLYHYLQAHPDVFMSTPKELHFFVEDMNWRRGWKWYQDHFAAADGSAVGEAAVTYAMHPTHGGVPGRIARYLPDVKLIYVLRHPVQRIRSEYVHRILIGKEQAPLDRAVLDDPRYVSNSRYALQIERYLEHFPREQLLLVTSDDLRSQREATVRRVITFLGLDPERGPRALEREHFRTDERRIHSPLLLRMRQFRLARVLMRFAPRSLKEGMRRPAQRHFALDQIQISDPVRRELEDRLRHDQRALRSYLGGAIDAWGIG